MHPAAPIGLIVNPRSGNDVRRVIARAGSSTLEDKVSIVRRLVNGLGSVVAAPWVVTNREPHGIVRRATETLREVTVEYLDGPLEHTEADTTRAAAAMREQGCVVVVVLGGDGTNRAAAKAWPEMSVIPLSTGTNNAFPYWVEPTVAGAAAGLLAAGLLDGSADSLLRRAKVVRVLVPGAVEASEGSASTDVALIDAVAVADRFVGSLELFDPATMRVAVLTRADPAAIGFSAVGGLLQPCGPAEPGGLLVRFAPLESAPPVVVRAPTAPGHYADVGVAEWRSLALGEPVEVEGPVLLAFDGERKRRLHAGERAILAVHADGPRVVDVRAVMATASRQGLFVRQS